MGKWVLYLNRDQNLTLSYRNSMTGQAFKCGELRRDTPQDMVLRWILDQATTQTGDVIRFQDGTVLQVQKQGEA